jgi:hypothetical protein
MPATKTKMVLERAMSALALAKLLQLSSRVSGQLARQVVLSGVLEDFKCFLAVESVTKKETDLPKSKSQKILSELQREALILWRVCASYSLVDAMAIPFMLQCLLLSSPPASSSGLVVPTLRLWEPDTIRSVTALLETVCRTMHRNEDTKTVEPYIGKNDEKDDVMVMFFASVSSFCHQQFVHAPADMSGQLRSPLVGLLQQRGTVNNEQYPSAYLKEAGVMHLLATYLSNSRTGRLIEDSDESACLLMEKCYTFISSDAAKQTLASVTRMARSALSNICLNRAPLSLDVTIFQSCAVSLDWLWAYARIHEQCTCSSYEIGALGKYSNKGLDILSEFLSCSAIKMYKNVHNGNVLLLFLFLLPVCKSSSIIFCTSICSVCFIRS